MKNLVKVYAVKEIEIDKDGTEKEVHNGYFPTKGQALDAFNERTAIAKLIFDDKERYEIVEQEEELLYVRSLESQDIFKMILFIYAWRLEN